MQKGSGVLWALERRGAMQIARFLLQASLPAGAARTTRSAPATLSAVPRRGRRRPRSTALRLVLPC